MDNVVLVSLISLIGTVIGAFAGSWSTKNLVVYRLSQLEIKVDRHNHLGTRITVLEHDIETLKNEMKEIK